MPKRHADAIAIQRGGCNPIDAARLLVDAIDEMHAEGADTKTICADPAIRLIAHQLASQLNVAEVDNCTVLLIFRFSHIRFAAARTE